MNIHAGNNDVQIDGVTNFYLNATDYIAVHDYGGEATYFSINQNSLNISMPATNINFGLGQYFSIRDTTTNNSIISNDNGGNIILNGNLTGTAITALLNSISSSNSNSYITSSYLQNNIITVRSLLTTNGGTLSQVAPAGAGMLRY